MASEDEANKLYQWRERFTLWHEMQTQELKVSCVGRLTDASQKQITVEHPGRDVEGMCPPTSGYVV